MNVQELFNLGIDFKNEGNDTVARAIFSKVISINPDFAPAHLEQHNKFRSEGNLVMARQSLVRFLNCPVTGISIDMVPSARAQLAELDKQLNPQPQPPPAK